MSAPAPDRPRERQDVRTDGYTRLCDVRVCTEFWRTGQCSRGSTCRYGHLTFPDSRKQCKLPEGMCPCPLYHAPKSANICAHFLRSYCTRGDACLYTHDVPVPVASPLPLFDGKTDVEAVRICTYNAYAIQNVRPQDRARWLFEHSVPYFTRDGKTFFSKWQDGEGATQTSTPYSWATFCVRYDQRDSLLRSTHITSEMLTTDTMFGRHYRRWLEERRERLEEMRGDADAYTAEMYVSVASTPFLLDVPMMSGN